MGNSRGGLKSKSKLMPYLYWGWRCGVCSTDLKFQDIPNHSHKFNIWEMPRCYLCDRIINIDKLNHHFANGNEEHRKIYYDLYPERMKTNTKHV